MNSSMRTSWWRAYLEDGEPLAAHVLLCGRDPQIGDGFHGLSMECGFGYFSGQIRTMERVLFPATKLFGQNVRLCLTAPCRSPIPTSLAPAISSRATALKYHEVSALRQVVAGTDIELTSLNLHHRKVMPIKIAEGLMAFGGSAGWAYLDRFKLSVHVDYTCRLVVLYSFPVNAGPRPTRAKGRRGKNESRSRACGGSGRRGKDCHRVGY